MGSNREEPRVGPTRTRFCFGGRKVLSTARGARRDGHGDSCTHSKLCLMHIFTYIHTPLLDCTFPGAFPPPSPVACYVLKKHTSECVGRGWMPPSLLHNCQPRCTTVHVASETARPLIPDKLHANQFSLETRASSASSQPMWNWIK